MGIRCHGELGKALDALEAAVVALGWEARVRAVQFRLCASRPCQPRRWWLGSANPFERYFAERTAMRGVMV